MSNNPSDVDRAREQYDELETVEGEVRMFSPDYLNAVEITLDILADTAEKEGKKELAEALFRLERELSDQMKDHNLWFARDRVDIALGDDDWALWDEHLGKSETRLYPAELIHGLRHGLSKHVGQSPNMDMVVYIIDQAIKRRETYMIATDKVPITMNVDEWAEVDRLVGGRR